MILVLVCMFMVSLIGAMILSTTLINYKMKITRKQSLSNFYSAEAVMEEVSTRVRHGVMDAYRKSYETLLTRYLDPFVEQDRQEYFMMLLASELAIAVQGAPEYGEDIYVSESLGDTFFEIVEVADTELGERGTLECVADYPVKIDVEKQELRLQGIHLLFLDENGTRTTIRTDIVLSVAMPDDAFENAETQVNRYIEDYVVVANGKIISDASRTNGAGETKAIIDGSIYTGKNLEIESGLEVNGDRIVIGESLMLPYGSSLQATMGQMDNDGIWARNIELAGGKMELTGDCYVVDDTTFSEENSKMSIRNGGYYGYSYSEKTEGNPYLSSAILINKPNITLDLSGADMLWLAGNAYIRETQLFDEQGIAAADGVLEGESLAYKNMQPAYLIPGKCLVGVGHNPIVMSQQFSMSLGEILTDAYMISELDKRTEEDMEVVADMKIGTQTYHAGDTVPAGTLLPVGTVLPANTKLPCDISTPIVDMLVNTTKDGTYFTDDGYYIDLTLQRAGIGIDLSQFVDARNPFIVRYSNTKQMAYYYLRFLDPQNAADYFEEFLSQTVEGRRLLQQLTTLGDASVLLPPGENIVSVGNLTRYTNDSATPEYGVVSENPVSNLLWREALLTSSYNSLLTRLTPGGKLDTSAIPKEASELDAFSYLINQLYLAQADEDDRDHSPSGKKVLKTCLDEEGNEIQLCVIYREDTDDFTVCTEELEDAMRRLTNAVVITNGNVTVDTPFAGVIIAKGDVRFQISGTAEKLERNISIADALRHKEIGPYFNAYRATKDKSDKDNLEMSEMLQLHYEGWKKN